MLESKRSRGLALSAVSALAITGLTFTPTPSLAAPGEAVVMLSQLGGKASVRPDGGDTGTQYVQLVAERLDPDAAISFEVNADPAAGDATEGWTLIDDEPNLNGQFASSSWDAAAFVGGTVSLRAVATTDDATSYSTVTGVAVTGTPATGEAGPHSTSVSALSGGYFRQPYASSERTATQLIVDGSTSATEGTVDLSWWRSSDGTFRGDTDAALTPGSYKVFDGTPNGTNYAVGRFHEVLDITGYDAEAGDGVLALRAVRDSDEVTPVQVYEQTIEAVSSALVGGGNFREPEVDVRVFDVHEGFVAGAEVRRMSDESVVGYTNVEGSVTASQDAGTTETYYVNTTDTDAYEQDVDRATGEVTTPEFTPSVTDVAPVLVDGYAFDDDEYADGDIALQVVDQDGEPMSAEGEEINYSLHENSAEAPEPSTETTDADGRLVVPFDPAGPDGEYVLGYTTPNSIGGQPQEPVRFTSGDATLTLTPEGSGTASSGGQVKYTGNLSLGEVPLAGRSIELAYTRGTEEAPGTEADAGIVDGDARVLTTTVTTDEEGAFSVTVADPVETGRPAEGGTLTATATAAQESDTATITFAAGPKDDAPLPPAPAPTSPATVKLKLTGSSKGRAADKLKVAGTKIAAGQTIRVFAKIGKWRWKVVSTTRLDQAGRVSLKLRDRNGTKVTSYRVELTPTAKVAAATSNVKRLR